MGRPLIVGLAGGVASGKSTVAGFFRQLGASVIQADRLGHEVLREEQIKNQIRAIWGEKVFEAGEINRSALATVVFDPAKSQDALTQLERITHPRIRERIWAEIDASKLASDLAIVLDVPLLFEAGWDEVCDKIVFVNVDSEIRRSRALARGWSEQHWEMRESRQISIAEKKRGSDVVVDNSGDSDATFRQIKLLWTNWGFEIPAGFDG